MEDTLARAYLTSASRRVAQAREELRRRNLADGVRFSQESVEFSFKAALRWAGIDYPKQHDVSDILEKNADRFPRSFRDQIEEVAPLASELARQRSIATYGLEREGKPPSEVFKDAEQVRGFVRFAERVNRMTKVLFAAKSTRRSA
jgi:HEPN domain-containing protein